MRTAAAVLVMAAVLWPAAVFAGGEAGLEARGVDPWASLRNRWGLDVRDEMNRPVSAKRIESQLKAASVAAALETAAVSRLPQARLLARLQEMLAALEDLLKPVSARFPGFSAWAMLPAGSLRLFPSLSLISPLSTPAMALPVGKACAAAPAASSRLPIVLRC